MLGMAAMTGFDPSVTFGASVCMLEGMIQACERCGRRIPDDRMEPICDHCGIAMLWPWGFVKLLALAAVSGGLISLALWYFR